MEVDLALKLQDLLLEYKVDSNIHATDLPYRPKANMFALIIYNINILFSLLLSVQYHQPQIDAILLAIPNESSELAGVHVIV